MSELRHLQAINLVGPGLVRVDVGDGTAEGDDGAIGWKLLLVTRHVYHLI